jgi:regulator of nonsense transcripts 1
MIDCGGTPPNQQVKAKRREVSLHPAGPLGDAVLECYASGSRNVFSLGYVPVAGDAAVALLARDTPPSAPIVRSLGLDLSQVCVRVCCWVG